MKVESLVNTDIKTAVKFLFKKRNLEKQSMTKKNLIALHLQQLLVLILWLSG